MRQRVLAAAAAVLITVGAAACGADEGPGGSADTSQLTIATGADVDTLDPAAQLSGGTMQRVMQIVESLTAIDDQGKVKPLLATEWEPAQDGMSWEFTLREGVKFSDGEPFDADAVRFSLERLTNPNVVKVRPDALAVIKSVDVIDATHVRLNLKQPYPALPRALFLPTAGIISPKSATRAPNSVEQIKEPVGTGPYTFAKMLKGDRLELTANEDYWGEKPAYAKQTWQVVPEATSRLALLRSGGADIVLDPPGNNLKSLGSDPNYALMQVDLAQTLLLFLNERSKSAPQLADVRVRQAISSAIDREQLVDSVAFGAGTPATSPLPKAFFGSCDTGMYDYDPDEAKKQIADAGATGMTVRMIAPNGRYLADYSVGQAVAGSLRAIGLNVELANPTDFPSYLASLYLPENESVADISMIAQGSLFVDGGHYLTRYQTSDLPPDGYNGSFYSNPEYDKLVDVANENGDEQERAEQICAAAKKVKDDAAVVWLYVPSLPVAHAKSVTAPRGFPTGMINTSWVTPA